MRDLLHIRGKADLPQEFILSALAYKKISQSLGLSLAASGGL